jgi:hypothetical protein
MGITLVVSYWDSRNPSRDNFRLLIPDEGRKKFTDRLGEDKKTVESAGSGTLIESALLSQLGTLFVHRLTNDQDREVIERACGDLDRAAAQFIPTLAPGEAIMIGPDLPAPLSLNMTPPFSPPDSKGPAFQKYWRARGGTAQHPNATHDSQVGAINGGA